MFKKLVEMFISGTLGKALWDDGVNRKSCKTTSAFRMLLADFRKDTPLSVVDLFKTCITRYIVSFYEV
jgi:hypothetical protein